MLEKSLRRSIVILLTLTAMQLSAGCSFIHRRYGEECKSRAYVRNSLAEFINARYPSGAPVRMAIVPFTTEANLSSRGSEFPGLGNELAWKVHAGLLKSEEFPIVEVFNRQDWPAKKEEFFTGNFGAISTAREAGYDLVMVGLVEGQKSLDSMTVFSKVMDVEAGITVWYGKVTVTSRQRDMDKIEDTFWITDRKPANFYFDDISEKAARCLVKSVLSP